jgi:hypothetical protein
MKNYNWNLRNNNNENEINSMINTSYNIYLLELENLNKMKKTKQIGHFKSIYIKILSDIKDIEKKFEIDDFVDIDLTCLLRKRMLVDFNLIEDEVEIFYSN